MVEAPELFGAGFTFMPASRRASLARFQQHLVLRLGRVVDRAVRVVAEGVGELGPLWVEVDVAAPRRAEPRVRDLQFVRPALVHQTLPELPLAVAPRVLDGHAHDRHAPVLLLPSRARRHRGRCAGGVARARICICICRCALRGGGGEGGREGGGGKKPKPKKKKKKKEKKKEKT